MRWHNITELAGLGQAAHAIVVRLVHAPGKRASMILVSAAECMNAAAAENHRHAVVFDSAVGAQTPTGACIVSW